MRRERLKPWLRASAYLPALLVACALLAACSSNHNGSAKGTPAPKSTPIPGTTSQTFAKAPSIIIDPNKGYTATIKTAKGDIVVELNAKLAPITVNNFVFLAQQHFYDGLTCHRVIVNFVAQCGDPKGDGTGGPGYAIPDEPSPMPNVFGAVAMAKSGPNTAGSQFYIVTSTTPLTNLDGGYTVFGQVISGMDVVQKLTPRDPSTATNLPPGDSMISVTIQQTVVTPTPFVAGAAPLAATGTPSR